MSAFVPTPRPAAPSSLYVDQPKPSVVKGNLIKALFLFQGVLLSWSEYKQAIANL